MAQRLFHLSFLVLLLGGSPLAAQVAHSHDVFDGVAAPCVLQLDGSHVSPHEVFARADAQRSRAAGTTVTSSGGSATFVVTYSGFTPAAQDAFQRAVDIWSTLISSPVPIRINASFSALGSQILGSAGPRLIRNFVGAPVSGTFYPYALADARNGEDLDPSNPDIVASFSSSFTNFYFGLDGNPPSNQFDFVSIVLHELGHGLGFVGSGRYDNGFAPSECTGQLGNGCWGYFTPSSGPDGQFFGSILFDTFVEDASGADMLTSVSYPNNSSALGTLFRSGQLFLNAPTAASVNGGFRPQLHAPTTFVVGSSFSHWDESTFPAANVNALMTPQIGPGESYDDAGPLTCALFIDLGWAAGSQCQLLVPAADVPRASESLSVRFAGPNPFANETALVVSPGSPSDIQVDVVDALGRVWSTTTLQAVSGERRVAIDGRGLSAGVYFVRVTDGAGAVQTIAAVRSR